MLSGNVSETGYKHYTAFPICGTGQGLTNFLMIWCFISCTLFECHKSESHSMKSSTQSVNINIALNLIGLLDYTTYATRVERTDTVQDLLKRCKLTRNYDKTYSSAPAAT